MLQRSWIYTSTAYSDGSGVPKSAKYIDRMPTDDLKRIQETLQTGRQRMDDYRAIFVNRAEGFDYMWWTELPMICIARAISFAVITSAAGMGELTAVERPRRGRGRQHLVARASQESSLLP